MVLMAERAITIGDKVRLARDAQFPQWSMADLEARSGVSATKMYEWEAGRTKQPRRSDVEMVAKAFDLPVDWFYDGKPGPPPAKLERIIDERMLEGFATSVAIRTWESASAAMSEEDDCQFEQAAVPDEVLLAFVVGGIRAIDRHDLVKVRGFSMAPEILPGDKVLFFNDGVLKRNTIVMVQSPEHAVMIKALRVQGDKFILESLSKDGATFTDLTDWQIFGHAVAIFGDDDGTGRNVRWPYGQPIRV